MFPKLRLRFRHDRFQFLTFTLVYLGQNDLIGYRRLIQHIHHLTVCILETMAGIYEQKHTLQHGPAFEKLTQRAVPASAVVLETLA